MLPSKTENISPNTDLAKNPWSNVYWFARMLLNSDRYAEIGKYSSRLLKIGTKITAILEANKMKIILN